MPADFPGAFDALREILKRHADGMIVQADTPTEFTVVTRAQAPNGRPMWFGCVSLKKSAVTYHLMPLYFNPKLQAAVPPELLRRKQGKTCFNFQRPDAALFAMLDELTRQGREGFVRHGLLEVGPVSQDRLAAAMRAGGEDPEALARLRRRKGRAAAAKRQSTTRKRLLEKTAQKARRR
jgi:hypothetical protein